MDLLDKQSDGAGGSRPDTFQVHVIMAGNDRTGEWMLIGKTTVMFSSS